MSVFMLSNRIRNGFAFTNLKPNRILAHEIPSTTTRRTSSSHYHRCYHQSQLMMNTRDVSTSSVLTRTEVRKMKVADLKKQLKARNLDVNGLRNDLMQRLLDHLEDTTSDSSLNRKTKIKSNHTKNKKEKYISPEMQYVLRYSGLSNHVDAKGSCGLILYNADTEKEVWSGYMFFQNGESAPEAEMKGLLIAVRNLLKLGVKHLIIQGYAQSAVLNQLQGNFGVKSKDLKVLYERLQPLMKELDSCEVWGIPQDQLRKAQRLAKKAIQEKDSTGFDSLLPDDAKNDVLAEAVDDDQQSLHAEHVDDESTVTGEDNSITWTPLPTLSPRKEYILRFDGGSRGNPGNAGAGMALFDSETGLEQWCAYKWLQSTTNNVAEYEGLIIGLEMAKDMGARHLVCEGDSTLIIKQVTGEWACKKDHLKPLYKKARDLIKEFDSIKFQYIPRADNGRADELANIAMDRRSSSGIDIVDPETAPLTTESQDKDDLLEAFLLNLPEPLLRETVDPKKAYTLRFTGGSKSGCYASVAEIVDSFTNEKKWNGAYFTHDTACTQVIAQYCGLILGLRKASAMGIKRLLVDSPSQVVIRQLNGKYGVKNNGMKICHRIVRDLCKNFDEIDFSDDEIDEYSNMNVKTLYHIAMQERQTLLGDY